MPRPYKRRRICACGMPGCSNFGPLSGEHTQDVVMTVDEFETIRLIDLEGLTQEECSRRMNVARTTVQAIYNGARRKLADSLVNGKHLKIQGGDYVLCEGGNGCGCGHEGCTCGEKGCICKNEKG